jgi:hypothetical protein
MNLSRGGTRGMIRAGPSVVVADGVVAECPQPDTKSTAAAAPSAGRAISHSQRRHRDCEKPALELRGGRRGGEVR